jgi:hypothetical protein
MITEYQKSGTILEIVDLDPAEHIRHNSQKARHYADAILNQLDGQTDESNDDRLARRIVNGRGEEAAVRLAAAIIGLVPQDLVRSMAKEGLARAQSEQAEKPEAAAPPAIGDIEVDGNKVTVWRGISGASFPSFIAMHFASGEVAEAIADWLRQLPEADRADALNARYPTAESAIRNRPAPEAAAVAPAERETPPGAPAEPPQEASPAAAPILTEAEQEAVRRAATGAWGISAAEIGGITHLHQRRQGDAEPAPEAAAVAPAEPPQEASPAAPTPEPVEPEKKKRGPKPQPKLDEFGRPARPELLDQHTTGFDTVGGRCDTASPEAVSWIVEMFVATEDKRKRGVWVPHKQFTSLADATAYKDGEAVKRATNLDELKQKAAADAVADFAAEVENIEAQMAFEKSGVVLSDEETEAVRLGQKRIVGKSNGSYIAVDIVDPLFLGNVERYFLEVYQPNDMNPEGVWIRIGGEGWATRDEAAKFL